MATKKSTGKAMTAPAPQKASATPIADVPDRANAAYVANAVLRPSVASAVLLTYYTKNIVGELNFGCLVDAMSSGIKDMLAGDMERPEAMLYAQAHSLQAIFVTLAQRATKQEHMKNWEAYLRMALKAQNQCRMTLETLATIKNPPVVFARQANINNGGQQQVNNGPAAPTRAREIDNKQNELLEATDGERLDTRAQGAAGGIDSHLETVGTVDRAAHP